MKKIVIMIIVLHCLFAIVSVPYSMAAIYKYIDKDGIICFADDLQVIPERYRASAVIVGGESKEDTAKAQMPTAADSGREQSLSTAQERPQKSATHSLSYRLTVSGCVIFGSFLVFIIISNQAAVKKNKKLTSTVRNSLIGIIFLYLLTAHVKDVITIFGMAGNALDNVQQQSEEKGRKTAQAIKKLDGLFDGVQKTGEGKNQPNENNTE